MKKILQDEWPGTAAVPARPPGHDQGWLSERVAVCAERSQYSIEPVGAKITDKEQLTAMYPNSFDRIGSLKGEYTIKIDPTIAPVQQVRRKVTIESKEAICMALDSMIAGDILEPQIEPTPWVNSTMYPVKVRLCLDCMPLNKAIIRDNHTLPTVEEIAHELAGVRYFMKGNAYKAFLHVSHFSYTCKMRFPLNLVLESWEYLWFYITFWIAILDCGLKLHKLSIYTLVMLQKMIRNILNHCLKFPLHCISCHICYGKISEKNFSTVIKDKLLVSKASNSYFKGLDFFQMVLASHR